MLECVLEGLQCVFGRVRWCSVCVEGARGSFLLCCLLFTWQICSLSHSEEQSIFPLMLDRLPLPPHCTQANLQAPCFQGTSSPLSRHTPGPRTLITHFKARRTQLMVFCSPVLGLFLGCASVIQKLNYLFLLHLGNSSGALCSGAVLGV